MPPDFHPGEPEPPGWTETVVALERIDLSDERFRITTQPCDEMLVASIRTCNLVNPPILRENPPGLIVVSGFRRVEACRRAGFSRIRARIFSASMDEAAAIRWAVADNAFQRSLNPVEASRVVTLLSRIYPDPGALADAATRVGFPLHRALVEKLRILGRLPQPVQDAVACGLVALPTALELATLDPGTAVELTVIFRDLRLGLNLQREILLLTTEIARREDAAPLDILNAPYLERTLKDKRRDRVQKSHEIRRYLRRRRFPHLVKREDAFNEWVKKLRLGPGVVLSPPRDFEGPAFSLHLQFKTLHELSEKQAAIQRILDDPDFPVLLDT